MTVRQGIYLGSAIGAVIIIAATVWVLINPERRKQRALVALQAFLPWLMVGALGGALAYGVYRYLDHERAFEKIVWRNWNAIYLLAGAGLVGLISFHLHRRRSAALAFSQTALVRRRGLLAWISDLPGVFRVLAVGTVAVALMRPETFRTIKHEEDSVDIMIVFDMSKSMEETDMQRDRMDAAQRVVRRFVRRTKHDRVGLVVFGQQAMLKAPLTGDMKLLEQIVSDLTIGDVPELGTAIGDGLALALASLRRSDGICDGAPGAVNTCAAGFTCSSDGYCDSQAGKRNKVVILLSDGDSNWVTRFEPDEAARAAAKMNVKVYTVLVGREENDFFGGMSVNPATLRSIASLTGGDFYRATDFETFDKGFQAVRNKLDKIKRTTIEKVPDKQLFLPLAFLAAILFGIDLLLSHTRFRRLP